MYGAESYLGGRPDLVWALERAGHQPEQEEIGRSDAGEVGWAVYCYNCRKRYRRYLHYFFGLSPRRPCRFIW
jgi:hypothetical protein